MDIEKLVNELVDLYHKDFDSCTILCYEKNKIVIKWYSDYFDTKVIDTGIEKIQDGINLYNALAKKINFIELAYTLQNLEP